MKQNNWLFLILRFTGSGAIAVLAVYNCRFGYVLLAGQLWASSESHTASLHPAIIGIGLIIYAFSSLTYCLALLFVFRASILIRISLFVILYPVYVIFLIGFAWGWPPALGHASAILLTISLLLLKLKEEKKIENI